MRNLFIAVSISILAAICGCGREESKSDTKTELATSDCSEVSKSEAKETPDPLARRIAHESDFVERATSSDRQLSAEEQAHEFCAENGLELGFDEEQKIITLIVEDGFEYEKKMSDDEFARKRYAAVKRLLMMAAADITRTIVCKVEAPGNTGGFRGLGWNSSFRLGSFPDDEGEESWIPQLMGRMNDRMVGRATDKRFSWKARLSGSSEMVMMECLVYGLSIVRQFESLSEDAYQVALIVSLDAEKGKDEIMSFGEERLGRAGKMTLQQWMDTQDFGLVAGPRRFVDNEGTIWAIGVVPAAEGQQPYGTLLDAAARECAAFAFGGDLAVSINGGDAENHKEGSFIEFKGVGTDWYPRELEQYFRRPYTHPLTGRNGVVAICALRSGASKIMNEIMAQKIKAQQMRQFEEGMRDVMREKLKDIARELNFDSDDVDAITQHQMRVLKQELSRIGVELQHERSMRPENRKRIMERLAELIRKIEELKGGKNNENQ